MLYRVRTGHQVAWDAERRYRCVDVPRVWTLDTDSGHLYSDESVLT
jgi:hypothetical protein